MKRIPISGQHSDLVVWVDDEDWDAISKHTWWVTVKSSGYRQVYTQISRQTIALSRMIMDADSSTWVDHIDRNPLNNCRDNLRLATPTQNALNTGIKSSNTSGMPGVDWRKDREKWRVTARINGVKRAFGHYDSFDEACEKRWQVMREYYGEWCPKYRASDSKEEDV